MKYNKMKNRPKLFLVLLVTLSFNVQKSFAAEYVLFEFISVSNQNREDYLSTQQF